jgi:hypothetical protein
MLAALDDLAAAAYRVHRRPPTARDLIAAMRPGAGTEQFAIDAYELNRPALPNRNLGLCLSALNSTTPRGSTSSRQKEERGAPST